MKIGVCTTDFVTLPADELFHRIAGIEFDSVQFAFASVAEMNFTPTGQIEIPSNIPADVITAVNTAADRYCLPINAINGTFNMAHPDPAVRIEGICRFEVLAKAAKELNCPIITLCSGTRNADNLWAYHKDNCTAEAWADMITSAKQLCEIAERYNITLAVETEAANIIDTPDKARAMMDEVGSPRLKMIMDCANLFRVGEAHTENVDARLKLAFEQFGADIAVAHGKDIRDSDGINFCATGEGIINYALMVELLRKYNFNGDMMLHGIYDESKMPAGLALMRRL